MGVETETGGYGWRVVWRGKLFNRSMARAAAVMRSRAALSDASHPGHVMVSCMLHMYTCHDDAAFAPHGLPVDTPAADAPGQGRVRCWRRVGDRSGRGRSEGADSWQPSVPLRRRSRCGARVGLFPTASLP